MNNPIPLEYLTSFSQTSQALMQQLATGLLTRGDNLTDFARFRELASVQQDYLQQMGELWVNAPSVPARCSPPRAIGGWQAGSGANAPSTSISSSRTTSTPPRR